MSSAPKPKSVLNKHLQLCEDTYALILEENHWLKSEKKPPSESIIEKKKSLVQELESSTNSLKEINANGGIEGEVNQELAKRAQNMLMKIFMLDRENEQLLLRATMTSSEPAKRSSSPGRVRDTYQKGLDPKD